MQKGRITKKRPCKVCRRWFIPHPRAGDTQKTVQVSNVKKNGTGGCVLNGTGKTVTISKEYI